MNFELIDNCFQVAVLMCAGLAAIAAAIRHKDRRFLILALFFVCVSMGTLYWVLHIFIFGDVPQVFYVSECSWLAAYLFLLSFQMVRTDGVRPLLSLLPLACALFTAAVVLAVFSAIVYLAAWRLRRNGGGLVDGWMLLCVGLQMLLYVVSCFMADYTRFNLYFAVDITLTFSFAALLPLALREVAEK